MKDQREVFICECRSAEHQMIISYIHGDDGFDFDMLGVEVHLNPYHGFWSRVKGAIKYIFGHKSKYGNWDSFDFNPDDADKLIAYLTELKNNREAVKKKVESKK